MVTDLALDISMSNDQWIEFGLYSQVPREVDIEAILDRQVVTQELQRDDVQEPLQSIDSLGYTDCLHTLLDAIITVVANDDGLGFASGDLCKGRLNLGVQRILRHDDDHGHVFVNQGQRTVLQFTREDALRVHVADFLDLQGTLQASGVPR